jgi:probable rRNA maturation factor
MAPLRFDVVIENRQKKTPVSRAKLARWVRRILKLLGWRRVALSVVLVTDAQIRKLHLQYRGEDSATDVLAFGQLEGKFFPQGRVPFLGDIVVSVETAKRVSPQYENRWDTELLVYVCHGILHLMGWRDSTPSLKAKMDRKQDQILKRLLGSQWRSKKLKRLF